MDTEAAQRPSVAEGEERRKAVQHHLAVANQKIRSAVLLWSSEQLADGLRLACEGFRAAVRAVELAGQTVAGPDAPATSSPETWDTILARLGATPDDLSAGRNAERCARTDGLPVLNSEVDPAHESSFQALATGTMRIADRVKRGLSPRPRWVIEWWMWAAGAGLVAVAITIFALISGRGPAPAKVQASAHYGDEARFAPGNVLDNNPQTEWLLPTHATGWIEVATGGGPLKTLKLLNGRNAPHNDRAVLGFRVEAYKGSKVIHTSKQTFGSFNANPQWLQIPLKLDRADRVRIIVETYHNLGGALADIAWE